MTWTNGPLTIQRHTYGRNVVRYAGGGSGTLQLTRSVTYVDGRTEAVVVAGALGGVPGADPGVWIDGDVPFGAKVQSVGYRLGSTIVVVPVEDRAESVLSDPATGLSVTVIGTEIGDRSWESSTSVTWLDVQVGGSPLVHSRPEQAPTQQFALFTTTRADREAVAALCGRRVPLLLRTPDTGVDDMWFVLAGERTEQRLFEQHADDEWRKHTWTAHSAPRPSASLRHAGDTLGALYATEPTTLGAIAARWTTLGAIAAEPLVPEREAGW